MSTKAVTPGKVKKLLLLLILITPFGCATVPPESVILSDNIGKDIVALQSAHTQLIRQYFGSMRTNANNFVDTVYRPNIVRHTIEDLDLINMLIAASQGSDPDRLDPLDIMEIYTEEALNQISVFRTDLLKPINQQEERLLAETNQIYSAILNANSAITAHLDSVVKVHGSQSKLLGDIGLPPNLREEIAKRTMGFTQELDLTLVKLKQAEDDLNEKDYEELIDSVKEIFK